MNEFKLQVALSTIGIGLCFGLQIVPIIFNTMKILKIKTDWLLTRTTEIWKADLINYYL